MSNDILASKQNELHKLFQEVLNHLKDASVGELLSSEKRSNNKVFIVKFEKRHFWRLTIGSGPDSNNIVWTDYGSASLEDRIGAADCLDSLLDNCEQRKQELCRKIDWAIGNYKLSRQFTKVGGKEAEDGHK